MAGFSGFINFNNGEALEPDDLNQAQTLLRRFTFDEFMSRWLTATGRVADFSPRVMGNALAPRLPSGAGLQVTIDDGLVGERVVDALTDSVVVPEHRFFYYPGGDVLTFAAADAVQFRRDLVQFRIIDVPEATVARDFEDAVTRAKSSQLLQKRTNYSVEFQVKTGSLVADADTADLVSSEPAVDAGWFRLCSVRIDAASTTLATLGLYDWRRPMGITSIMSSPRDWQYNDTADWNLSSNGHVLSPVSGSGNEGMHLPIGVQNCPNWFVRNETEDGWEMHRRVQFIQMFNSHGEAGSTPNIIRLLCSHMHEDTSGPDSPSYGPILPHFNSSDLTPRITVGAGIGEWEDDTLYSAADIPGAAFQDPPLWTNGFNSPCIGEQSREHGQPDYLTLQWQTAFANNNNVGIGAVKTVLWGL